MVKLTEREFVTLALKTYGDVWLGQADWLEEEERAARGRSTFTGYPEAIAEAKARGKRALALSYDISEGKEIKW